MTSDIKTEARFGLSRPDYPQVSILERCSLNYQGEVKTEARFGLSGPSYLLGPDFEAVIVPIEPVEVVKKKMSLKMTYVQINAL